MISSIKIFSFLHNCKTCFEKYKVVDLDKPVNKVHFSRQPKYLIDICSKVVGRINNNHFNFYDFKMYILTQYMFKEKINWSEIKLDTISDASKNCSNIKYEKDSEYIKNLLNAIEMDVSDLFKVNSNGNNILLDLIIEGKVSPIYYILQYHNPDEFFANPKYDISSKLDLINKRTETIKNILRRN